MGNNCHPQHEESFLDEGVVFVMVSVLIWVVAWIADPIEMDN